MEQKLPPTFIQNNSPEAYVERKDRLWVAGEQVMRLGVFNQVVEINYLSLEDEETKKL